MSSNRLLATLLASAAILWPVAANAVTIGTVVAHAGLVASTTPSFVTSAAVPPNGLFVIAGSYNATNTAPSVTGCASWTKGQDNSNGAKRTTTWYCQAGGSGVASGATVTLSLGSSTVSVICAVSYPATVTTHDSAVTGGNTGTGTAITWGPATPTQASEVIITSSNFANGGALTDDVNYSLLCDEGSGATENYVSERVIASTSATSYSATYSQSAAWATGFDGFFYSTGGATCTGGRMRRGYGGC